jgi:hypothetical protein
MTAHNTRELLRVVHEEEPADDAALQTLIDRIDRQARWHAALATTWHKYGVISAAIAAQGNAAVPYTANDKQQLQTIDLDAADRAASLDRSDADQEQGEVQLDQWDETLIEMYKGEDQQGFLVCPGPEEAVILGSLTVAQARPLPGPETCHAERCAVGAGRGSTPDRELGQRIDSMDPRRDRSRLPVDRDRRRHHSDGVCAYIVLLDVGNAWRLRQRACSRFRRQGRDQLGRAAAVQFDHATREARGGPDTPERIHPRRPASNGDQLVGRRGRIV